MNIGQLWCKLGRHKLKAFIGIDVGYSDTTYTYTIGACARHCGLPATILSRDLKSIKVTIRLV